MNGASYSAGDKLVFKAFLSHRYKSPAVNLYFYDLLSVAEVQFEVDEGISSTNVTRLERAVRNADAFIGLYPFDGDPKILPDDVALRMASRYFRLEVDLAIRAGKPTLVFYDQRFGQVLDFPASVWSFEFDIGEVTGRGGSPQKQKYRTTVQRFCEHVAASMSVEALRPSGQKRETVGLVIPTGRGEGGYTGSQIEAVEQVLRAEGIKKMEVLAWPPVLTPRYFADLDAVDWVIVDIGPKTMETGIVGYLHGRAIPTLRLYKGTAPSADITRESIYGTLYGGVEVGYAKDIVKWQHVSQLRRALSRRLATLLAQPRRISTGDEAREYFETAARQKETVFVSYAGRDAEIARPFIAALRKRFQTVFDYKDGESITPGEPWLEEIFESISTAGLGVPLVSPSYVDSDNCKHEAQEIVARRDSKEMHLMPVKLYPEKLAGPSWMRNLQYLHLYDYPDVDSAADKLVQFLERARSKKR